MSAWSRCGQPSCWQTPRLPLLALRDVGPLLEAEPLRLDRLPDVDERVADDEHVRARRGSGDGVGDPALLGARHQVVDQHADPAVRDRGRSRAGGRPGRRRRRGTRRPRPRSAGRRPRPSRPARRRGGPRRRSGSGRATRALAPWTATEPDAVRVGLAGAPARGRRGQDHRPALEQEARTRAGRYAAAAPVLEGERVQVAVDRDDLAAPVGGDLLDDRAPRGGRLDRAAALRGAPVAGEDVGAVAVA